MNQIEFGKFIYKLRIEANLTQDELAEKVGVASGKTVSKWENGYSLPDIITLKKLSIALNVTLYELTECKRLKKKRLIDATKDFVKSSKDIFKLNIICKVTIVITVLLGIFFGLCTIFTINNYGTVEIYTLKSLDKNFYIKGNITLTNSYNTFTLLDIDYIGEDESILNTDAYNIEYKIMNKNQYDIVLYSTSKNKNLEIKYNNLIYNMKTTHFYQLLLESIKKDVLFKDDEAFIFQIIYEDKNNNVNVIEFPFKIINEYKNIF